MDKLIEKIIQTQNPSVVGLDTDFAYLPDEMRAGVTDFEGAAKTIVKILDNLTNSIVNKIFFDISKKVKKAAKEENKEVMAAAEYLFDSN